MYVTVVVSIRGFECVPINLRELSVFSGITRPEWFFVGCVLLFFGGVWGGLWTVSSKKI